MLNKFAFINFIYYFCIVKNLEIMKNLAKTYRLAGIKGMCESNGTIPVKKKVDYKSQFVIVERLENESFQDWKERCKINK